MPRTKGFPFVVVRPFWWLDHPCRTVEETATCLKEENIKLSRRKREEKNSKNTQIKYGARKEENEDHGLIKTVVIITIITIIISINIIKHNEGDDETE